MNRLLGALVALVPVVGLLMAGPAAAQTTDPHAAAKRDAQGAAESWLRLVDDDAFGESWDAAAPLLQKRIRRENWVQKAQQLRDTVQTLAARRLATIRYRDSLQQAPSEGPFVLLRYRSTFGAGRFEELLLTVRQDTTWRVTGYQVTPLRAPAPGPPDSTRP
jgi:hypothetical protein